MKHIKKFEEINENGVFSFDREEFDIKDEGNIQYLNDVKSALDELQKAHLKLSGLWYEDQTRNIDLNEYLSEEFPYELSFDDILLADWVSISKKKIDDLIDSRYVNDEPLPPVDGDALPGGV